MVSKCNSTTRLRKMVFLELSLRLRLTKNAKMHKIISFLKKSSINTRYIERKVEDAYTFNFLSFRNKHNFFSFFYFVPSFKLHVHRTDQKKKTSSCEFF
jgi:hypothetical protein